MKDLILSQLRKKKIKLWLSPYYIQNNKGNVNDGVGGNTELRRLANELAKELSTPLSSPLSPPSAVNGTFELTSNDSLSKVDEVLSILLDLQSHAVQKLIEKYTLDVKVLATEQHTDFFRQLFSSEKSSPADNGKSNSNERSDGTARENCLPSCCSSWGENVEIIDDSTNCSAVSSDIGKRAGKIGIRIVNISENLKADNLSRDICSAFNATSARILWKGKNLLGTTAFDGNLRKMLAGSKALSEQNKKKNEILCILSGFGRKHYPSTDAASSPVEVAPLSSESAAAAMESTSAADSTTTRSEQSIISSIRAAAQKVQHSNKSRFEVTDQSGQYVSMSDDDMTSFLTALGLHRLGRSKMDEASRENRRDPEKEADIEVSGSAGSVPVAASDTKVGSTTFESSRNDSHEVDENGTNKNGACTSNKKVEPGSSSKDNARDAAASALIYLLEADSEWQESPALSSWKDKVDNYGLLQLDIAWCCLLLESLDDLPGAIRRLNLAESILRKQVHSNFVTLALAQAEMDHQIPPLCAIFVRLFLLQGVAAKLQNTATGTGNEDVQISTERLDWARLLCNRLRATCPVASIKHLQDAYWVDKSTAIAALRQSNGDLNSAGNFITDNRKEDENAAKKRRRQRKIGKCSNGTDFVNLDLAQNLCDLLGLGRIGGMDYDSNDEDDRMNDEPCMNTSIVIGLLRLSNNDLDRSLELYQQLGAEGMINQIQVLDSRSNPNKRTREREESKQPEYEVREDDLIMIVSMGVEESKARDALKMTGDVDDAVLWLSKSDVSANATGSISSSNGAVNAASTTSEQSGNENAASDRPQAECRERRRSANNAFSARGNSEAEAVAAEELLTRELGSALENNSKNLEKEWLGVDLDEEWNLIEKYT